MTQRHPHSTAPGRSPSRTGAAPHAPRPAADQANTSPAAPPGLTFSVSVSASQHLIIEMLRRPVEFTLYPRIRIAHLLGREPERAGDAASVKSGLADSTPTRQPAGPAVPPSPLALVAHRPLHFRPVRPVSSERARTRREAPGPRLAPFVRPSGPTDPLSKRTCASSGRFSVGRWSRRPSGRRMTVSSNRSWSVPAPASGTTT